MRSAVGLVKRGKGQMANFTAMNVFTKNLDIVRASKRVIQ